jgi:hypothetical protein
MKTDSFNLAGFSSISLEDLNKVKLRDRQDTKFVFNQNILPLLLDKLNPFYQVLEINGMQTFVYDNTYFDSDDFLFYKQHHNENRKRFKVRYRKFSSNIGLYFEIYCLYKGEFVKSEIEATNIIGLQYGYSF